MSNMAVYVPVTSNSRIFRAYWKSFRNRCNNLYFCSTETGRPIIRSFKEFNKTIHGAIFPGFIPYLRNNFECLWCVDTVLYSCYLKCGPLFNLIIHIILSSYGNLEGELGTELKLYCFIPYSRRQNSIKASKRTWKSILGFISIFQRYINDSIWTV